jgi:hypothetical protein
VFVFNNLNGTEMAFNILCSYTASPQSIIGSIFGEAQGEVRTNLFHSTSYRL